MMSGERRQGSKKPPESNEDGEEAFLWVALAAQTLCVRGQLNRCRVFLKPFRVIGSCSVLYRPTSRRACNICKRSKLRMSEASAPLHVCVFMDFRTVG